MNTSGQDADDRSRTGPHIRGANGIEHWTLDHAPTPDPSLTIVTSLDQEDLSLLEAGRSVALLAKLIGKPVEWVIACDGPVRAIWVASLLQRVDQSLLTIHILGSNTVESLGAAANHGRALAAAKGKYVGALDADDRFDAAGMALMYRQLAATGLGWAAGWSSGVDKVGTTLWDSPTTGLPAGEIIPISALLEFERSQSDAPVTPCFILVATETIRAASGWDESLTPLRAGESALWVRLRAQTPGIWTNLRVIAVRANLDSATAEKTVAA